MRQKRSFGAVFSTKTEKIQNITFVSVTKQMQHARRPCVLVTSRGGN